MKKFAVVITLALLGGCGGITSPLSFDSSEYEHYLQVHQAAKFGKRSCPIPSEIRNIVLPTLIRKSDNLLMYTQYKLNTGESYKIAGELSNMITEMDKQYNYNGSSIIPSESYCVFKLENIRLGAARAMTAIGKETP